MSFVCAKCEEVQPNGTKPIQVVTETRSRVYKNELGHVLGIGVEIVKEEQMCQDCAPKTE